MIDLHSHTIASDGRLAPADLVRLARRAGVTHLAVTDHDTVAGLDEADEAARAVGLTLVPGIEISTFLGDREIHVLGHFVDRRNAELAHASELLRDARKGRMERMILRLGQLGYPVTMAEVRKMAGTAPLGRPHLARVMVERRYVRDLREAFDRFLATGKAAYVDRYRLSVEEAIGLVKRAGGTATLAHPGSSHVEREEIVEMRDLGLAGLEVDHVGHDVMTRERMRRTARELDLVATAGSDYHGDATEPGRGLGSMGMDPSAFEELQRRAGQAA